MLWRPSTLPSPTLTQTKPVLHCGRPFLQYQILYLEGFSVSFSRVLGNLLAFSCVPLVHIAPTRQRASSFRSAASLHRGASKSFKHSLRLLSTSLTRSQLDCLSLARRGHFAALWLRNGQRLINPARPSSTQRLVSPPNGKPKSRASQVGACRLQLAVRHPS